LSLQSTFVKTESGNAAVNDPMELKAMFALSRGRARLLLLLAIPCCATPGCGPAPQPTETSPADGSPHGARKPAGETVELALNWFPEAEHGGYFAAVVHGFYKEAGISVKILP
jgi:ABC-type nitrate/sulfonate/bicarbonate transport system substrate-binding protein